MKKSKDSIQRQYLLKKLKRDKRVSGWQVHQDYIDSLITWINKQVERANKKSGGLGK